LICAFVSAGDRSPDRNGAVRGQAEMEFADGADGDLAVVEDVVEGVAAAAVVVSAAAVVVSEVVQMVAGDGYALVVGGAESGEGAGHVFEVGDWLVRGGLGQLRCGGGRPR
jgi:hypothetical protein